MHRIQINKMLLPLAGFLLAAISTAQLCSTALKRHATPLPWQLHSLSVQFEDLRPLFTGLPRAGYYSDKNMEVPLAVAQFEQAQYVLAPTILELNNTSLPLVIFDCTSPTLTINKIKELGLRPVLASNTGIVLAAQPPKDIH